jgi:tetratricopeptide (TPR) repeat protein/transcriptional regulator with XRE-family HTH domain
MGVGSERHEISRARVPQSDDRVTRQRDGTSGSGLSGGDQQAALGQIAEKGCTFMVAEGGDPARVLVAGFCRRLEELRTDCGVKQASLARRLGKSNAAVSEILNGKIRLPPSWDDVAGIVTACASHTRQPPATAPGHRTDLAYWRREHEALTRFAGELRGAGEDADPVAVLVTGFCGRLQEVRAGSGVQQKTLARSLGKGEAALSEILNGKIRRPPSWDDVAGIVTACASHTRQPPAAVPGHGAGAVPAGAGLADPGAGQAAGLARWRQEHEMLTGFARQWRKAAARTGSRAPGRPPAPVPRQLPADVPAFAGRAAELAGLDRLLTAGSPEPATVVISAVSGTAGVGKTALAVHWAHRVAGQFPDGQLYVNLRGFGPDEQVMDPAEAVRGFLDALGVPPQRIPAGLDAQAGLYRSLLSGRRILIVLDNARDSAQARPLLPGAPGCLALVTSRSQLSGLVTDGARPLGLDLLTPGESRELLARRIGPGRVAAEPQAAGEIITRCARLPLALAIVAARAAAHPRFPLAALAAELHGTHDRWDALTSEDPGTDVRAVFSWSCHALTPGARRLFRLLGLHPGPDISAPAAASLAGLPLPQVRPRLAELAGAHLITEHVPGRYTFHDLLRAYAASTARGTDPGDDCRAAIRRVLDHYLHTAHTADRLLNPTRDPVTLTLPQPGVTPEEPGDHEQALAWFTAEHLILLAAVDHASAAGLDTCTWQLAWTLWTFQARRGHWRDQAAVQRAAVAATTRLADPCAQALAHRLLAQVYTELGCYDDARTHSRHALGLYRQVGNQPGQAYTHNGLAFIWERQGRHAEATGHARQALSLFRAAGHRRGPADALNTLGWLHIQLGDCQQGLSYCQEALTLHQELGIRDGQAATWDSLGYARRHLGQYPQAAVCYQHALALYRDLGDRYLEANTLNHIGDTHRAAGDIAAARDAWQQAMAILDELDHPDAEQVLDRLADVDAPASGDPS